MARSRASLLLTDRFHEQLARLADEVTRRVGNAYGQVVPQDIEAGFDSFVPMASDVAMAGQVQASALGAAYFNTLLTLETGDPGTTIIPILEDAGSAPGGKSVQELLMARRADVLTSIKEGASVLEALRKGLEGSRRAARFLVSDAGNREVVAQVDASDRADGWRTKSAGTCGACLAMDDGGATSRVPPFHMWCNCVTEPRFNVPDRFERETGVERFEALSAEAQDATLGPLKATLLRAGAVSWTDLFTEEPMTEWSPMIVEAPLEKLLSIAGLSVEEVTELANG